MRTCRKTQSGLREALYAVHKEYTAAAIAAGHAKTEEDTLPEAAGVADAAPAGAKGAKGKTLKGRSKGKDKIEVVAEEPAPLRMVAAAEGPVAAGGKRPRSAAHDTREPDTSAPAAPVPSAHAGTKKARKAAGKAGEANSVLAQRSVDATLAAAPADFPPIPTVAELRRANAPAAAPLTKELSSAVKPTRGTGKSNPAPAKAKGAPGKK